jgi:Family of unknown function (DUF6152)
MAVSVFAHHATTAVFDLARKVTVTGTLTQVDWVNPHIAVFIDAKNGSGDTQSWRIETNPPAWFQRINLERQNFAKAIGQTVIVEANPAKDGTPYGFLMNIKFEDGTKLEVVPDQSLSRRNRAPE